MEGIPVLAFSGYSGAGKTTVIEKLLPLLRRSGLRTAVVKHDAHGFEIDHEGKDSWRFSQAGAEMSVVSSSEQTAVVERRELPFLDVLALVHDVDLILVEGYKRENLTQIGVCRRDSGKPFPADLTRYCAVVTDLQEIGAAIPRFDFYEMDYIVKNYLRFTRFDRENRSLTTCPENE